MPAKLPTAAEIVRLRELCEKSTPGPWRWFGVGNKTLVNLDGIVIVGEPNDSFITAARTALPAVLDALEEARKALFIAVEELHYINHPGNTTFQECKLISCVQLHAALGEEPPK